MTGLLSGARQAIGHYFSLVSFLPSVLLVVYCYALFNSKALSGPPDFDAVRHALATLNLGDVALLTLVSLAVGVVMHPLQYMIVQLAEGYWGLGTLSRRTREWAIGRHQHRRAAIVDLRNKAELVGSALESSGKPQPEIRREVLTMLHESHRLSGDYPDSTELVMPTRLGNVLRRYEVGAGAPFGLPASALLPLIGLVAPANELNYLNDRRAAMDLAVRTATVAGIAFVSTVAFFWDDGLWLLAALIPYAFTYLCYRGAIVQAHDYGNAMANIIAMNRFTLYDRLHLKLPDDAGEERDLHDRLRPMLDMRPLGTLAFTHSTPPVPVQAVPASGPSAVGLPAPGPAAGASAAPEAP
jgi:hypothetical protein